MKLGGPSRGMMSTTGGMSSKMSSMMSSSSTMSSSSSSTSTSSKSMLGGGSGMQMPSLGMPGMPDMGMMMGKGLDIEELSTAGTDVTGPPAYTVTSTRPSTASPPTAAEMSHLVQAAADYKKKSAADTQEADHTVLLKLKQGDEYKLVLNMQQYSPENITVKLNDDASLLTVMATAPSGSVDDFKQTHRVPEGIDLDQMTSSFSSDGILVIKAPREK